jgi:NADPH2:quinone reductase
MGAGVSCHVVAGLRQTGEIAVRAVVCKELSGPGALALEEVAAPTLGPGQVRIAVHAAGLNFADTLIIQGKYQERPDPPFTPGMELAGVVAACAADVAHLAPGARVLAMTGTGAFAEEAVVDAGRVVAIPDSMTMVQAAGFPVAYGTSHLALDHRGRLQAGEVLLVLGASGGVGLTAVEIGKAMGATVIAAASSAEKLGVARDHGADHLVDYTAEDLRAQVKEIAGAADVIYDPVGGDLSRTALRCINWEGRMLVIGFASGEIPQIPANYLLVKNAAAVGVFWGAYRKNDPARMMASLDTLLGWFAAGKLRPHISHELPLDKAADAFALMMGRKSTGKVVLTTGRQ